MVSLDMDLGRDGAPLCGISDMIGINSLMSMDDGKMKQNRK